MGEALTVFILLYMMANAMALIYIMATDDKDDVKGFRVKDIIFMIIFFPLTLVASLAWLGIFICKKIAKLYNSKRMKPLKNFLNKRVV